MGKNAQRPGVMIYFDAVRPALNRLNDGQCGALLRAIVDYAQYGTTRELDQMTGMVFDLLVPKIDRDGARYEESREQRQYAVYVREIKKRDEIPLPISQWRLSRKMSEGIGPIHADNGSYLSATIAASTPTPTTIPTSTAASGEGTAEGCKGEGEGGPEQLYTELCEAMDAGDNKRALDLHSQLYRLGYNFDPSTRKLTKR